MNHHYDSGAFGTNCSRKLKLINSYVALNMPGPEAYRYDKKESRPLSLFGNSVFTSKTVRMGTNYKDKQNYPAPAEYSVHNYTISKVKSTLISLIKTVIITL